MCDDLAPSLSVADLDELRRILKPAREAMRAERLKRPAGNVVDLFDALKAALEKSKGSSK